MRQALSFNQDLGLPGEVIVEFFAGMPVPIKRCVWRYFYKVYEHFTIRNEALVERLMQKVCHLGLRLARSEAGASKESGGDAKCRRSNKQETHTASTLVVTEIRFTWFR